MYVNAGYEYWGRAGSLIHTTIDGNRDVDAMPNERIYLQAAGQHGTGGFPPRENNRVTDGLCTVIIRSISSSAHHWQPIHRGSLRTGFIGGSEQLYDFDGMFIPLPRTAEEREQ